MRLTRIGWASAVGAAAMGLIGRVFGLREWFVGSSATVVVIGLCAAWMAAHPLAIELVRSVTPRRVPAGGWCRVKLDLRTASMLGSGSIELTDRVGADQRARLRVPPVTRNHPTAVQYRLPLPRRGVVSIGPISITSEDPFGIWRRHRTPDSLVEVIVLPRVERLTLMAPTSGEEPDVGRQQRSLTTATDEISTLRDYQPGDDVRRVHWPTTARLGHPVVRQYDEPWQRRLTVVIDVNVDHHDAASFERAMSVAASVLESSTSSGQLARMVTTRGTDSGFVATSTEVVSLLDQLAAMAPSAGGSLDGVLRSLTASQAGGSLVTICGKLSDQGATILAAVATQFSRHVIVECHHGSLARGVTSTRTGAHIIFNDHGDLAPLWSDALLLGGRTGVRPVAHTVGRTP